jgi:hypothetical protein
MSPSEEEEYYEDDYCCCCCEGTCWDYEEEDE